MSLLLQSCYDQNCNFFEFSNLINHIGVITHRLDLYRRCDDKVVRSACTRADKHAKLCGASSIREHIRLALVGETMTRLRIPVYLLEQFGVLIYSRSPSEISFITVVVL